MLKYALTIIIIKLFSRNALTEYLDFQYNP